MTTESTSTLVTGQEPNAGVQADAATEVAADTVVAETTAEPNQEAKPADEAKPAEEVVYDFKVPEGVELDKASTEEFKGIAKELKLPAEAAQKFVDLAVKREQAQAKAHADQVEKWADAVRADTEIGGDKLAENLATARKAIDLGPPELKELLNASGMGNHPAVVKWALAVGKALSEDGFVKGAPKPTATVSIEDRMYPKTAKS